MSFNIRYGTANDGENSWPRRSSLVLDVINEYDPDLLGLQESLSFQSSAVGAALAGYSSYGPSREGPGTDGEACTIFWRDDRFQSQETGTFWLSPTPELAASNGWDAALPRVCSWVRLLDRSTRKQFLFANTHFDHRGEQARVESAKLIASRLNAASVILVGDFNADEESAAMGALRGAGFADAFRALYPQAAEVGTFTGFKDTPRPGKIDYVYTKGPVAVLEASIDSRRHSGKLPSDHFPVTATVRFQ
jgi:endonuclease/exonuclease/phosphatase family metal-dependent hydrolase